MTDDIAPSQTESGAGTAPKSSADRVRAYHSRQLAKGQRRLSVYLSRQEFTCLDELTRHFQKTPSIILGACVRDAWERVIANKRKTGP